MKTAALKERVDWAAAALANGDLQFADIRSRLALDGDGNLLAGLTRFLGLLPSEAQMLGLGTVRIKLTEAGLWDHHQAGTPCLTLPIYHRRDLLDLIAFPITGGPALSHRDLVNAFEWDYALAPLGVQAAPELLEPWNMGTDWHVRHDRLRLCRDVVGWIKSGFKGVVVLDMERHDELFNASWNPRIQCDDEAHAEALEAARKRYLARVRPKPPKVVWAKRRIEGGQESAIRDRLSAISNQQGAGAG